MPAVDAGALPEMATTGTLPRRSQGTAALSGDGAKGGAPVPASDGRGFDPLL
jgi:hypothetical protein